MSEGQSSFTDLAGCDPECRPCNQQVRYCVGKSPLTGPGSRGDNIYETGCLLSRSSESGILQTTHDIPMDGMVELNFRSDDGRTKYRAETIVRWVEMQDAETFHVGLEFQKVQRK